MHDHLDDTQLKTKTDTPEMKNELVKYSAENGISESLWRLPKKRQIEKTRPSSELARGGYRRL